MAVAGRFGRVAPPWIGSRGVDVSAWWHKDSRTLVVITKSGAAYRIASAGPVEERAGAGLFRLEREADGVRVSFGRRSRKVRGTPWTAAPPAPPEWRELDLGELARVLLGPSRGRRGEGLGSILDLVRGAGSAAAAIAGAAEKLEELFGPPRSKLVR